MWFNGGLILSYKKPVSIVVDLRGIGKTYWFKRFCLKLGIQQKKKVFVWIRRREEDIKKLREDESKFFSDVGKEDCFKGVTFKFVGCTVRAIVGNENFVIGEFVALSTYHRMKSISFDDVTMIVFDEFLAEDGRYLKNEVSKLFNLLDSVARSRDNVRLVMLSNSVSMINPYFEYWKIDKLDNEFCVFGNVVVQSKGDYKEYKQKRANSFIGQIIAGSDYDQYATENKFLLDDNRHVIDKKPVGTITFMYNLLLDGEHIGLWLINNIVYVGDYQENGRVLTFNPDDALEGAIYCQRHKSRWFKDLISKYLDGSVYFKNLKVKNLLMVEFEKANYS